MRDVRSDGASPWARIDAVLNRTDTAAAYRLRAAASPPALRRAERTLGMPLPADVVDAYRDHDGQEVNADLLGPWSVMPIGDVVQTWGKLMAAAAADGSTAAYDRHWIPVAANGAGDYHVVDATPGSGGRLLLVSHELRGPPPTVADGLRQWLDAIADQLDEHAAVQALASQRTDSTTAPPPTVAELDDLLGLPIDAPALRQFVGGRPDLELYEDEDDQTRSFISGTHGYTIVCAAGRVDRVELYFNPRDSPGPFSGVLPRGLDRGDSCSAVRGKLGDPTSTGNIDPTRPEPQNGWDRFTDGRTTLHCAYLARQPGISVIILQRVIS